MWILHAKDHPHWDNQDGRKQRQKKGQVQSTFRISDPIAFTHLVDHINTRLFHKWCNKITNKNGFFPTLYASSNPFSQFTYTFFFSAFAHTAVAWLPATRKFNTLFTWCKHITHARGRLLAAHATRYYTNTILIRTHTREHTLATQFAQNI